MIIWAGVFPYRMGFKRVAALWWNTTYVILAQNNLILRFVNTDAISPSSTTACYFGRESQGICAECADSYKITGWFKDRDGAVKWGEVTVNPGLY